MVRFCLIHLCSQWIVWKPVGTVRLTWVWVLPLPLANLVLNFLIPERWEQNLLHWVFWNPEAVGMGNTCRLAVGRPRIKHNFSLVENRLSLTGLLDLGWDLCFGVFFCRNVPSWKIHFIGFFEERWVVVSIWEVHGSCFVGGLVSGDHVLSQGWHCMWTGLIGPCALSCLVNTPL